MSKDAKSNKGDRWAIERCERLCKMDSMRFGSEKASKLRKDFG